MKGQQLSSYDIQPIFTERLQVDASFWAGEKRQSRRRA